MMAANVVRLKGVAQDGVRVRASAGSGSFRRRDKLQEYLRIAREQVELLAQEGEDPDPKGSRGEQVAKERAARERQERVEKALRNLEQVQAAKERQRKKPRTTVSPLASGRRLPRPEHPLQILRRG